MSKGVLHHQKVQGGQRPDDTIDTDGLRGGLREGLQGGSLYLSLYSKKRKLGGLEASTLNAATQRHAGTLSLAAAATRRLGQAEAMGGGHF